MLPAPFFYDAGDTFMDYYNTNYWAYNSGRFEEWKSIYPLFVFVISKIVTSAKCIAEPNGLELRNCDINSIYYLVGSAVLACVVSAYAVLNSENFKQRFNSANVALLIFIFISSIPLLNSMERGNYVIICLLFLALSIATPTQWVAALFFAMAINIKQYLILLLLTPFLKRQWGYLYLVILACLGINILSLFLISEPKYDLIFQNMLGFSESFDGGYFQKVWNPTSFVAWDKLIRLSWHVEEIISSNQLDFLKSLSFSALLVVRLLSFIIFILILSKSERLSQKYISVMLLVLLMVNLDALGGYSLILLFPFLGAFSVRPLAKWLYLFVFGVLFPLEIPTSIGSFLENRSWLSGLVVHENAFITFGAIMRPCFLLALMCTMGLDILIDDKMNRNFY